MRWDEFERACAPIAVLARERFTRDQLVMIGSVRKDGSPRISPCEVDFAAGHLMLGMMWRSKKVLDLRRDPRVTVHSVTCNKDGTDGDVKLYGRAIEVSDAALRAQYRRAITARLDWAPDEPNYHLFALDVVEASFIRFGEEARTLHWDGIQGLRTLPPPH